ncbi:MAG: hypothetical protein EPO67_02805 [Reyranella sp.]|nr:MAG: hypothetical protein EPO67_02805 [Reyranella sp.]
MKTWIAVVALMALMAQMASAQSPQPYAGQETRSVKALSPQQIDDLRAGRGMGLALAAELNGYPGPMHVLELADRLALDGAQKEKVQALFAAMRQEAIGVGERLIAAETALDRQFAERRITEASLAEGTQAVAALQGELRATHLRYHLATVAMLSPAQVARYGELRGYSDGKDPGRHQHRRH